MHRPATITLRVRPLTRRDLLRAAGATRRAAFLGVAAAAAAVALAGCSTQSLAQTNVPYQPGDGVSADIGSVQARGLVVVAAAKGGPGVLVGSLINTAPQPVTVTFLTGAQAQNGTAAGPKMQLRGSQQQSISGVQFASVLAAPGDLTNIVLQTTAGQASVDVPVLPPEGYYSSATPTAMPSTATSATTSTATTSPATAATVTVTTTATATTTGG